MDPAQAYQRRLIETATPIGLIVLLFERLVLSIERAVAALERHDIETRTTELNRALAIIAELRKSLNFEKGGEVARQFDGFYQHAERQIVAAGWRRDPAQLRELRGYLLQIRDAWRKAEVKPSAQPALAEAVVDSTGEGRSSWRA